MYKQTNTSPGKGDSDRHVPCPRVMVITSEYPPHIRGGLGTHVFDLTKGLGGNGCPVTVLTHTTDASVKYEEANITVHMVSIRDLPPDSLRGSVFQTARICNNHILLRGRTIIANQKQPPQIIHCHDWLSFSAAHQLGRMFGIPVVATVHLLYDPLFRWWEAKVEDGIVREERALCRGADAVITVSNSMRDIIRAVHSVPDDKLHVVYNGTDAKPFMKEAFNPDEITKLRQSLAPANEKIVMFAGRISLQKGISALIESASQVVAQNDHVRYVVAGGYDNWSAEQITQAYKELYPKQDRLWNKLKFLGMVSREHLAMLYQVADIAIVPSIYEPFGYAATEAMAAGLPVIASAVGGLAEIVLHGETGLLVPVHESETVAHRVDVEGLTGAQIALLNNEPMARRMGQAGRQRALSEFNLERMIQSSIQVYQKTISTYPINKAQAARSPVK